MDAKTIIALVVAAPIWIPATILALPIAGIGVLMGVEFILSPLEWITGAEILPWHDFGNGQIG